MALDVRRPRPGMHGLAELGRQALCVLTVSDHILEGEKLSAEERQETFHAMIELTLEAVTQ